jgi:hypothetical protein
MDDNKKMVALFIASVGGAAAYLYNKEKEENDDYSEGEFSDSEEQEIVKKTIKKSKTRKNKTNLMVNGK